MSLEKDDDAQLESPFYGADPIEDDEAVDETSLLSDDPDQNTTETEGEEDDPDGEEGETSEKDDDEKSDDAKEGEEGEEDEPSEKDDEKSEDDADKDKEGEEDEEKDTAPPSPPRMVPKSRIDAKNERIRELERQLSISQGERPDPEKPVNIDLADSIGDPAKMFDAVLDGQVDTAKTLFTELMSSVAQRTASEVMRNVDTRVEDQSSRMSEKAKFNSVVDQVFEQYPMLDPESDTFNEETSAFITNYHRSLVMSGEATPDEAVRQAVRDVLPMRHPELFKDDSAAEETTARVTKAKATQRERTASKLSDLNEKQPPRPNSSAADGSEGIDLETITAEELDALPPATLAKLRGDYI